MSAKKRLDPERADVTIAHHFPEAVWTPKQIAEASACGRLMNRISR